MMKLTHHDEIDTSPNSKRLRSAVWGGDNPSQQELEVIREGDEYNNRVVRRPDGRWVEQFKSESGHIVNEVHEKSDIIPPLKSRPDGLSESDKWCLNVVARAYCFEYVFGLFRDMEEKSIRITLEYFRRMMGIYNNPINIDNLEIGEYSRGKKYNGYNPYKETCYEGVIIIQGCSGVHAEHDKVLEILRYISQDISSSPCNGLHINDVEKVSSQSNFQPSQNRRRSFGFLSRR